MELYQHGSTQFLILSMEHHIGISLNGVWFPSLFSGCVLHRWRGNRRFSLSAVSPQRQYQSPLSIVRILNSLGVKAYHEKHDNTIDITDDTLFYLKLQATRVIFYD
jgi:hypothetical protein